MFRTALGSVDPMQDVSNCWLNSPAPKISKPRSAKNFPKELSNADHVLSKAVASGDRGKMIRAVIEHLTGPQMAFLRPETAQAMFVQFKNVMDTSGQKPPFGIAQMGKSFRNEVTVEHFIFRSCEFEQMEMEFFCEPGTQGEWMNYWKTERMNFWQKYANYPEDFTFRQHEPDELAHYADDCYDVEYRYPWGWDELEGIASRTDHDLHCHEDGSGQKLRYTDQTKQDPESGKNGWTYRPYVIEPAAGATRGVLVYLLDAFHVEERTDAKGKTVSRTVLKLHPRLAPVKCAVLSLVSNKEEFLSKSTAVHEAFKTAGIAAKMDHKGSIGKRYAKHDEIGTPFCVTIDGQTLEDGTVTVRDRDTTEQQRFELAEAIAFVQRGLNGNG